MTEYTAHIRRILLYMLCILKDPTFTRGWLYKLDENVAEF